jgi:diguanylate cyclase (GGDEF)-like protein/PAS domain S-box-containing protein
MPAMALALLAAIVAGVIYCAHTRDQAARRVLAEVEAVADLKSAQISMWRKGLMRDALMVSENPLVRARARAFLRAGHDDAADLVAFLTAVRQAGEYDSVMLTDPAGNVKLCVGAEVQRLGEIGHRYVARCSRSGATALTDLHAEGPDKPAHLDLVIPLMEPEAALPRCVGIVLCRIDPDTHLFPIIAAWPRPSMTGECLLVRREGREAACLNRCRPREGRDGEADAPVLPRLLAPGSPGIAEGADPSGVAVLAALRSVPGTPWQLVAKIDCSEALAQVRGETLLVLAAVAGGVLISGALLLSWSERRKAAAYRRQAEAERERRALLQRYEWLTRYANDAIVVADGALRLTEVNERAAQMYAYSREEMLALHFGDIFAGDAEKPVTDMLLRAQTDAGLTFESNQRRRDGRTFPVEISLRTLSVDAQTCHVAIIRDITDRKRAEAAVRALSLKDDLTGLLSRRGLVTLGRQALRLATRLRNNAAILFLDIDGLKAVNDSRGHDAGDELLRRLARLMRETCREADLLARLGGDEFVILTVGQSAADIARLLARLRNNIDSDNARGHAHPLAVSVGIAHFDPDQPVELETLLHVADKAMYEEKMRHKGG